MGQKIHPTGFRLAVSRNWSSRWYANNRLFPQMLNEDLKVREYLRRKLKSASVGRVLIERPAKNARITIFSARPGVVIGKKGEDIEILKGDLMRLMQQTFTEEQLVVITTMGVFMIANNYFNDILNVDPAPVQE